LINEAKRLQIMTKAPFYIAKYLFTNEILKEIDQYEILLHQVGFSSMKFLFYSNKFFQ
jgi:hypothetical protein